MDGTWSDVFLSRFCDEVIHLFAAQELSFANPDPDEDEFLDIIKIPLKEAYQILVRGEIPDSKTQILILRGMDMVK